MKIFVMIPVEVGLLISAIFNKSTSLVKVNASNNGWSA